VSTPRPWPRSLRRPLTDEEALAAYAAGDDEDDDEDDDERYRPAV
jgi:hypothetical protein